MSKAYSVAFKQRMVAKLVGKHATSANRLAQETGVSQTALSQWRAQARNIGEVRSPEKRPRRTWTVGRKVEILAKAAELDGEQLMSFLEKEEVTLAELELWRSLLADDQPSVVATKRIKSLERELARKEKALAEAAALLILKKKLGDYFSVVEDENTDDETEK
jgi:transposase-like protein